MDDKDMVIRVRKAGARIARGLGDIPGQDVDPNQNYWVHTHGQPGKVEPVEVLSTAPPPPLPPEEKAKLDAQVEKFVQAFAGIVPFTRRPNWLDPPLLAKPIDVYTDPVVLVPAGFVNVPILQFIVPDGAIAVFTKFGNDLETSMAFPQVAWNFAWKGALYYPETVWSLFPVPFNRQYTYRNFHRKLGEPSCPCPFAMPMIVRGPGVWELWGSNGDIIGHELEARLMGYQYSVQRTDTKTDVNAEFML